MFRFSFSPLHGRSFPLSRLILLHSSSSVISWGLKHLPTRGFSLLFFAVFIAISSSCSLASLSFFIRLHLRPHHVQKYNGGRVGTLSCRKILCMKGAQCRFRPLTSTQTHKRLHTHLQHICNKNDK